MKRSMGILCAVLVFGVVGAVQGDVINFDDYTTNQEGGGITLALDYKGFIWGSNWGVYPDSTYTGQYGNTYGSPSGEWAAYNVEGVLQLTLESISLINFEGAYFTSFQYNNSYPGSATSVTVTGYKDDNPLGSVFIPLSSDRYDWFQIDLNGVNKIIFQSSGTAKWWLMDDFTYSSSLAPGPNPVPEPATMLLLGSGLVGLAGFRKKWKKG